MISPIIHVQFNWLQGRCSWSSQPPLHCEQRHCVSVDLSRQPFHRPRLMGGADGDVGRVDRRGLVHCHLVDKRPRHVAILPPQLRVQLGRRPRTVRGTRQRPSTLLLSWLPVQLGAVLLPSLVWKWFRWWTPSLQPNGHLAKCPVAMMQERAHFKYDCGLV